MKGGKVQLIKLYLSKYSLGWILEVAWFNWDAGWIALYRNEQRMVHMYREIYMIQILMIGYFSGYISLWWWQDLMCCWIVIWFEREQILLMLHYCVMIGCWCHHWKRKSNIDSCKQFLKDILNLICICDLWIYVQNLWWKMLVAVNLNNHKCWFEFGFC